MIATPPHIPSDAFDDGQVVSRQQAALQQIDMAIVMIGRKQFACAITLALAAETQIPNTGAPHVMSALQKRLSKSQLEDFNFVRNWLKHDKDPEKVVLYEIEVMMSLLRAISKFTNTYKALTSDMAAFDAWVKERFLGHEDGTALHPK